MKTIRVHSILPAMLIVFFAIAGRAQDQTLEAEVPGDNFSLEGALELFKKSKSPEDFERMLNSSDSKVNNLDLNGDGRVDYIRVIDRQEGNIHAFILQAVISQHESQDVAVIELEKLANGEATLQITGDADIYGIETIIEPTEEVYVNAGTSTMRRVVNVWTWPSVQYVYSPYYAVWVSPWGWYSWPWWWTSWRPVAYYVYHPWWRPYRVHYSVCYTHRIDYGRVYRPYRTTSVIVRDRHHDRIASFRSRQGGEKRYDDRGDGRHGRYGRDADRRYSHSDNRDRNRNSRSPEEMRGDRKIGDQDERQSHGGYASDRISTPERNRTYQRSEPADSRPSMQRRPTAIPDRTPQRIERQPEIRKQPTVRPQIREQQSVRPPVQRQPVQRQVAKPAPPSNRSVSRPSAPPAKPSAPSRSGSSSNNKKRGKN